MFGYSQFVPDIYQALGPAREDQTPEEHHNSRSISALCERSKQGGSRWALEFGILGSGWERFRAGCPSEFNKELKVIRARDLRD